MSIKFLHAADFHLDSAFAGLTSEQAKLRRRESRRLLERLSNYVNYRTCFLLTHINIKQGFQYYVN